MTNQLTTLKPNTLKAAILDIMNDKSSDKSSYTVRQLITTLDNNHFRYSDENVVHYTVKKLLKEDLIEQLPDKIKSACQYKIRD